jgi:hypothetical protein
MSEDKSNGSRIKLICVVVLTSFVFLLPPFLLIWFPEKATKYVSSHTAENNVRY